jgi:hypothetical protein
MTLRLPDSEINKIASNEKNIYRHELVKAGVDAQISYLADMSDEETREKIKRIICCFAKDNKSCKECKESDYCFDDVKDEAKQILALFQARLNKAVEEARKEGREQVKMWILNHLCHIGRPDRKYVYLGADYIKQCQDWDLKE